jgi:hypothetical protein
VDGGRDHDFGVGRPPVPAGRVVLQLGRPPLIFGNCRTARVLPRRMPFRIYYFMSVDSIKLIGT